MGFLDNKGLKKVLTHIKDYINNTLNAFEGNLSVLKDDVNNALEETAYKQTYWKDVMGDPIVTKDETFYPALSFYRNNYISYASEEKIFIKFLSINDNYCYLPDPTQEYILKGKGDVFKNRIEWPHTTQLPWPNSVIPEFKDDSEYTIHIVGGEVISCIENPSYKFSVTIEANIDEKFVDGTPHLLWHDLEPSAVYIDGVLQFYNQRGVFTKAGSAVIRLDFEKAISTFRLSCASNTPLRNSITKIDLSELNPDCTINIQNVSSSSDVKPNTTVVFPNSFTLKEQVDLYLSTLALEDFSLDYLRRTSARRINLSYGAVLSLKNGEVFSVPKHDPGNPACTVTFLGTKTENSILRKMANAFAAKGWFFEFETFRYATNLEQAGSVYKPWLFSSGHGIFKGCTSLKFASIEGDDFEYAFDAGTNSELREVILNSNVYMSDVNGPCDRSSASGPPSTCPSLDILVLNIPSYSLKEHTSWGFNPEHPTKVYIPRGWSGEDIYNLQSRLGSAWTLHEYDSLDEIPFQYAPEEINDIKD